MNNEKYKINGIVKIYDENHNLLQETHNMIVEEGRRKILKKIFNNDKIDMDFKYFYETGNESKITTPDMVCENENKGESKITVPDMKTIKPKDASDIIYSFQFDGNTEYAYYSKNQNKFIILINLNDMEILYNAKLNEEKPINAKLHRISDKDNAKDKDIELTKVSTNYIMSINETELFAKFLAVIVYSGEDQYQPINAVGLYWNENGSKYLFSRAAIDNVYMHNGRTYIIEHTVYF